MGDTAMARNARQSAQRPPAATIAAAPAAPPITATSAARSSSAVRAGQAFLATVKNDPDFQRWWDSDERRRKWEAWQAEAKRRVAEGHETWQHFVGEPMPTTLEDIRLAALRFGLSPDAVLRGDFSLADVTAFMIGDRLAAADAHVDRVRAAAAEEKARMAVRASTPAETGNPQGDADSRELMRRRFEQARLHRENSLRQRKLRDEAETARLQREAARLQWQRLAAGTLAAPPGAVPDTAPPRAEVADDEPTRISRGLSDSARSYLRHLLVNEAFDRASLLSKSGIADELGVSFNALRAACRELARHKPQILDAVPGRRGGAWLTPFGKLVAERVPPATCRQLHLADIGTNKHRTSAK
jgi:hypothetical protein